MLISVPYKRYGTGWCNKKNNNNKEVESNKLH